ncbi:hypothetical protein NUSPORA_01552 [Nucleospora cyclopteri]
MLERQAEIIFRNKDKFVFLMNLVSFTSEVQELSFILYNEKEWLLIIPKAF